MADKDINDTAMDAMVYAVAFAAAVVVLGPFFQRMLASTPLAQRLEAQAYTGLTDERVLNATPALQWINLISEPPYVGWITASFHNDEWTEGGVHYDWPVFIGINNPDGLHELRSGEDYSIDFSGADRRIECVFFKSNPGQRAQVRVVGKY